MIGYKLSSNDKVSLLIETLKSLRRVARSDPLLNNKSHGDGWGYVVLQDDKLYEYHSYTAIYNDKGFEELIDIVSSFTEYSTGIIHARRASKGMPKGLIHTYPYHYSLPLGHEVWLAFNGSLKYEQLYKRTDAYMLGLKLVDNCKHVENHGELIKCLMEEYDKLKRLVTSGGVLLLMILSQSTDKLEYSLIIYPYYKAKNTRLGKYYKHYLLEAGHLSIIIVSSSIFAEYNEKIFSKNYRVIQLESNIPKIL